MIIEWAKQTTHVIIIFGPFFYQGCLRNLVQCHLYTYIYIYIHTQHMYVVFRANKLLGGFRPEFFLVLSPWSLQPGAPPRGSRTIVDNISTPLHKFANIYIYMCIYIYIYINMSLYKCYGYIYIYTYIYIFIYQYYN